MTLLISVLLVLAVAVYVGQPLWSGSRRLAISPSLSARRREELLSQRESTYSAIKELDFEHDIGNMSEEDYRELRDRYRARAISLLQGLDQVEGGQGDLEELIEREVLARRKKQQPLQETLREAAPPCHQCGAPRDVGDRFCSVCGGKL